MSEEMQEAAQAPETLGNERRVQFAFFAMGAVLSLVFARVVAGVADLVSQQFDVSALNPKFASIAGLVLGVGTAFALYRHARINAFGHEVAGELVRVKWPSRDEAWSNTLIVIVASIVAAVIIFTFDSAWAWLTDFVYKV